MKKHKFSVRKPEAISIAWTIGLNKANVERFFTILREQREKNKFPASAVYNADESGLSIVLNKLPMIVIMSYRI